MENKKVSRRNMLKMIGLGTVGTLASACAAQPTQTPQIVTQVVKETVVVEKKSTVISQVEVTKEVQKEVTVVPVKGQLRVASINDPGVLSVMDLMIAGFKGAYPKTVIMLPL
jgi:hypothetical protein